MVGRRQIKEADNPVINIMTNFSILTSGIAVVSMKTSGIFIGRLISYGSVYSASILLPWEMENIFTENSAKIIKVLLFWDILDSFIIRCILYGGLYEKSRDQCNYGNV